MSANYVYAGAVAPENLTVEVARKESGLDLSTVSAVLIRVARPDGQKTSWSADITSQTPSVLVLRHVFEAGDVDAVGTYAVFVEMTIPSGVWRSEPRVLEVRSPFAKAGR